MENYEDFDLDVQSTSSNEPNSAKSWTGFICEWGVTYTIEKSIQYCSGFTKSNCGQSNANCSRTQCPGSTG